MANNMKDIGIMIIKMDMVKRHGQMEQFIKVITAKAKRKVMENLSGLRKIKNILDNSGIIGLKVMENYFGIQVPCMKESGKIM